MRRLSQISCFLSAVFIQTLAFASDYPHCQKIEGVSEAKPVLISARIADIETMPVCEGQADIVVLTLKSSKESTLDKPMYAYVAPNAFLMRNKMNFSLGDDVELSGISFVTENGAMRLTVTQISKGKHSLKLRDRLGRPMWTKQQTGKAVAH